MIPDVGDRFAKPLIRARAQTISGIALMLMHHADEWLTTEEPINQRLRCATRAMI
jgi:hypothetical protein